MRPMKWKIIAQTQPPSAKTAQEESRWLKLGDDVLRNRHKPRDDVKQLNPGSRAVSDLEQESRELQLAVEELQQANKNAL